MHLTVNAEHDHYRWGPITYAPSLLDGDGGFPRTVTDVWDHADVDEVRRECRAQVERAILWGFDVSHLDAHLGAVLLRPEFFDVYLELAVEFRLPIRLPNQSEELPTGFPFRQLTADEGVVFPDQVLTNANRSPTDSLADLVATMPPGVTELSVRPAVDTPELRAVTTDWRDRCADADCLAPGSALANAVADAGVVCIGYRQLRDLMRLDHRAPKPIP